MALTDQTRLAEIATQLRAAETARAPITPLSETDPGLSVADAYRIQQINVDARVAGGGTVRGQSWWMLGLLAMA